MFSQGHQESGHQCPDPLLPLLDQWFIFFSVSQAKSGMGDDPLARSKK